MSIAQQHSEQPMLWRRCLRVAGVMLVFVLVGPPVDGIVFMPAVALVGLGGGTDGSTMMLFAIFGMIYAMPLSYFIGWGPAALTGAFIGAWLAFYGPMDGGAALLTGLMSGLLMVGASGGDIASLLEKAGDERGFPTIAACLAATMVCWAIVQTWAMPSHAIFGKMP